MLSSMYQAVSHEPALSDPFRPAIAGSQPIGSGGAAFYNLDDQLSYEMAAIQAPPAHLRYLKAGLAQTTELSLVCCGRRPAGLQLTPGLMPSYVSGVRPGSMRVQHSQGVIRTSLADRDRLASEL